MLVLCMQHEYGSQGPHDPDGLLPTSIKFAPVYLFVESTNN